MITLLRQTFVTLKAVLLPKRYFSWQTVIYMSLFSWLMSLLSSGLAATVFTVGVMATSSWIFLALGVGWALEANRVRPMGISIAPWVSGAILCLFLFGSWGGRWAQPALTTWPLISFLVVAIPNLVSWELQPKVPPPAIRQKLVLLFFLSLLFSSWFQFYFRIQNWLQAYPSLIADDFDRSNFVYRIPGQSVPLSAGVTHLTEAETIIKDQLSGKPWPWVERWLLNIEGQQQAIQQQIYNTRYGSAEDALWRLDLQPLSSGAGYTLKLRAIWTGPTADQSGYYLEKTCQVMPMAPPSIYGAVTPNTPVPSGSAQVTCDLQTPRIPGQPRT
jgi:hypothetical protein